MIMSSILLKLDLYIYHEAMLKVNAGYLMTAQLRISSWSHKRTKNHFHSDQL